MLAEPEGVPGQAIRLGYRFSARVEVAIDDQTVTVAVPWRRWTLRQAPPQVASLLGDLASDSPVFVGPEPNAAPDLATGLLRALHEGGALDMVLVDGDEVLARLAASEGYAPPQEPYDSARGAGTELAYLIEAVWKELAARGSGLFRHR